MKHTCASSKKRYARWWTRGASLIGVAEATELPEFARWDQYDTIHRRNASIAFLRFERELLFKSEMMK